MSDSKNLLFSAKLKNIFWPIERSEIKLFLPLGLMMFCMLFNFGALRSVKDSLVVPNIGAEVISFLKLWIVLPSTIIFTMIYMRLSNLFNYEHVFYIIISFFLLFYAVFTYVIFPNQDLYHPSAETIEHLSSLYPNFKWFIRIMGKWSYSLMYLFGELWSVVIINLLFWQYANYIFDTASAKRFYPFLGMIGNCGLILAGNVLTSFSDLSGVSDANILDLYTNDLMYQCDHVLKPVINSILFSGLATIILYRYINRHIVKKSKTTPVNLRKTTKTKLSLKESIKLLLSSKYIGHIVLLVLCYGLLINILEGPWKAKIRQLYPNTIDYLNFMGKFNIWMGVSSVTFMIIGSNVVRRMSWLVSALVTPTMLFITGTSFFGFIILSHYNIITVSFFDPIYMAVIVGAAQNILSKSTKYSLFDTTKEMAYIPLSLELKTKGKAAVEVIGLKFGKSLGAFIQSFVFILMPTATFDSITIYLLFIFIIVILLWVVNVGALNKEYLNIKSDHEKIN